MKFWRSYKLYRYSEGVSKIRLVRPWYRAALLLSICLLIFGWFYNQPSRLHTEAGVASGHKQASIKKERRTYSINLASLLDPLPLKRGRGAQISQATGLPEPQPGRSVTTTVFWVGELAGPDNDYIANNMSAWDESWQEHFGGVDSERSRNGYFPAGFTPRENPFYFALPYSDFTNNGKRKASAVYCPNATAMAGQPYSWCKNSWIKIESHGKTVYAQWEDVGPNETDDVDYVFGSGLPRNTFGARAGLDVSPAVRDYLGLSDIDTARWQFVSAQSVPQGPWKQIVTTSLGERF